MDKEQFGKTMTEKMESKKVSADKLSIDLKIPKRTVYAYANGEISPSIEKACKIANYLNFTL